MHRIYTGPVRACVRMNRNVYRVRRREILREGRPLERGPGT